MLLIVICLILGFRYIIPGSPTTIEDFSGSTSAIENQSDSHAKKGRYAVKSSIRDNNYSKKLNIGPKLSRTDPQKAVIDLNTSDSATLVSLPGIGPVLSARIIKYRRLLGGFARTDQLKEVYGLPEETYDMIKGRIFADSTVITRININSSGYKELSRLPYFEKYEVSAILKYRELKGKISSITDLTENKLITTEQARKVGPYLKYDE